MLLNHQLQQCSLIRNGVFQYYSVATSPLQKRPTIFSLQTKAIPSRTQRIMESIPVNGEVGGAGGAYSYNALKRLDQLWSGICSAQTVIDEPKQVVSRIPGLFSQSDLADKEVDTFDVVVCGGTLGIFIATALSSKGLRVGIVEKNVLKGREQEWNISRKEMLELVEVGILEEEDIENATSATFNPNRCGFEGKGEIWVENILNLGVSPSKLIEIMKTRFNSFDGVILEGLGVSSICVYDDAAISYLHLQNKYLLLKKRWCFCIHGYPEWHKMFGKPKPKPRSQKQSTFKPGGQAHNVTDSSSSMQLQTLATEDQKGIKESGGFSDNQCRQILTMIQTSLKELNHHSSNASINWPSSSTANSNQHSTQHFAGTSLHYSLTSQSTSTVNENVWIIDSGATDHITPHITLLSDVKLAHATMHLPNGQFANVTHCGSLVLDGNIILQDVLYVPTFNYNLLSIPKLVQNSSCKVFFSDQSCFLQDPIMKKTIEIGSRKGGLYLLNKRPDLSLIFCPRLVSATSSLQS